MHRLIIVFVATWIAGCSQQPSPPVVAEPPADWTAFSIEWASASREERRSLAHIMKISKAFQGTTKERVKEVFSEADQSGVDDSGEDVLRYELGNMPESDGNARYHLTFVFDEDIVSRVMGNFLSE